MGIFRLFFILVDKVDESGNLNAFLLVQAPRSLEKSDHLLWRHMLVFQVEGSGDHFSRGDLLL